jgi:glycine/D-amino acid oxidase-like deaminating enzyme
MDVRSGISLWQGTADSPVNVRMLDEDVSCEVAIIGGGITGMSVAYFLLREGVDTILLDKHDPGAASTTASTGLLQYEIDTHLYELIEKVGEQAAVRSYRLGLLAIDEIERIISELPSDCGFERKPSLYLASSEAHLKDLQTEYECRASYGFDVKFLTEGALAEMSSFRAAAGIRSNGDAQFNPLQFTQQLLDRMQARGLRAFNRCQVTDLRVDAHGAVLTTENAKVKAQRVVIATGYAAHQRLKQDVGTLQSTYAIASKPLSTFDGWPEQCLLWETARPYFYLRSTLDGRAILGGEDTPFSTDHQRDQLVADKSLRLQQRFTRMFPNIPIELEFAWAGTFAETKDGLAYIGESPEVPNAYFALGYGGNGITLSVIAARIIADLFVRRPNSDAQIFRFDR